MNIKRVVLVTGVSGAGKTTAMAVLEDMGYTCIDRYPVKLLDALTTLILEDGVSNTYQNLALSVSAQDLGEFKRAFENTQCDLTILYLDASFESLLLRYKYNRRHHPLLVSKLANSLEDAINLEIAQFSQIKDYATIIIDTSNSSVHDLSRRVQEVFSISSRQSLSISFLSFGFRNGVPRDADLVFDVRVLKNPYWDASLRQKSGNDKAVFEYVMNDAETKKYLDTLIPYLDHVVEKYKHDTKHHLTVAIGCTGGQHRSVSIANYLHRKYRKNHETFLNHRDVQESHHD